MKNVTKKQSSREIRRPLFGQRVKAVRKHLKLKQSQMAEKLNISVTTLSDIETAKSYPGYDFFYNMSIHFKVNLYYLLFGTGEMLGEPVLTGQEADEPEKNENEMTFIVENRETREFLDYFFRSRIVQHEMMVQFFKYFNSDRASIMVDIEAIEKEKSLAAKS